jgi:Domain of unknown function (DUF6602)
MTRLLELLLVEGRRLCDEFRLASIQGDKTPQEVADFREHAVQDFLRRFYPASTIISKGKVTDLDGNQSNSIDCLVLNPAHPNLIDSHDKFRLIFADGCDAAIEVKPDLSRTKELTRALEQCISLKKMRRSKSAILLPARKPQHVVEHSRHIPFYVFSKLTFSPEKLYSKIHGYYVEHSTPREHQIDGICILGVGMLQNVKHAELNIYKAPPPIGGNIGWYFEAWGDATLLGLLLGIEYSFRSQPVIVESILKRVLRPIAKMDLRRLGDATP